MDQPKPTSTTYIIVRKYFMADYILDAIREQPNVVIVDHLPRKGVWAGVLRWLRMALGNRRGMLTHSIFAPHIADALRSVQPDDRVLLWGVENYKYTLMMASEVLTHRVVSFLWNPMLKLRRNPRRLERYRHAMKAQGMDVCTFDPSDAAALQCRLVPQVFRSVEITNDPQQPRVFFIGYEKGREDALVDIIKALEGHDIELDINVVRNKHHEESQRHELIAERLLNHEMPLQETSRRIATATAIIDIAQPGQQGITLRTLEAQFYRKKLITNNASVRREDFYHPENVYILGDDDDDRDLAEFVKSAYTPIDPKVLAKYNIVNWIENVFDQESVSQTIEPAP